MSMIEEMHAEARTRGTGIEAPGLVWQPVAAGGADGGGAPTWRRPPGGGDGGGFGFLSALATPLTAGGAQ